MTPLTDMLPPGKRWFTPREAGEVIGRTAQYVRDAFDSQEILGHCSRPRGSAAGNRRSYHIPRESLVLYLCETANYTGADFADRLAELLRACPAEELPRLREVIETRASQARQRSWRV